MNLNREIGQAKRGLGRMISAKVGHRGIKRVAKKAGVQRETLFRLMQGHGQFDQRVVIQIASVVDLDESQVSDLLRVIHAPGKPS